MKIEKKLIPRTDQAVAEITLVTAAGIKQEGTITIVDGQGHQQRFNWSGQYLGEGRWKIEGNGAKIRAGGARVPDTGKFPFVLDPLVNAGMITNIIEWLNQRRTSTNGASTPKLAVSPPLVPYAPVPCPPIVPPLATAKPNGNVVAEIKQLVPVHPLPVPPAPSGSDADLPGNAVPIVPALQVLKIAVNRIRRNENQPRKAFKKGALIELGKSLRQDGQVQPIEVIRVFDDPNADWELIIGERRWRAAQEIGLPTLDAIVRTKEEIPNKAAQHRRCFIADFHHAGYNKLETALALMEEYQKGNATMEELGALCGKKSAAWVSTHLALNKLRPELLRLLDSELPRKEQLSFPIAHRIAQLPPDKQLEVHGRIQEVKGSRLQLIEAKRLVNEIVPDRQRRKVKPADNVKNMLTAVPRIAADAFTIGAYPDNTLASLIANRPAEEVTTALEQIALAVERLQSLHVRIKEKMQETTVVEK